MGVNYITQSQNNVTFGDGVCPKFVQLNEYKSK